MSGVDEFEGGGGVDEVSKKLRLKSDVVSKVTSVVTLLASVGPEPSAPRDWSILNTSILLPADWKY